MPSSPLDVSSSFGGFSGVSPLSWVEFEPEADRFDSFHKLESAGGGWILRRLYSGPDEPIQLVVTTDGVAWSALSLPYGFQLADLDSGAAASVRLSGGRWVAFGRDVYAEGPGPFQVAEFPEMDWAADRVWFSDDRGETWIEMRVQQPQRSELLPPFVTEESEVLEVLASGNHVVVVVQYSTEFDLEALVDARGLRPPGYVLMDWEVSSEGVSFGFEAENPSNREREVQAVSYADLGLSAEQQELLSERGRVVTRIFSGDSAVLGLRAEFEQEGWNVTGVGSAGGFVLAAQGSWDALLTSPEGKVWTSEPLGAVELWADGGEEARWAANRTANGVQVDRIRRRDGRTTAALLEDVENFSCFSAGPAGVAVAALTANSADRPALMESITRVADGSYVRHRGYSSYQSSEVWVGWSADGAAWEWQTAADAFGIDLRMEVSVELAVGRDFVLARVVLMGRLAEFPSRRHTGFGTRSATKGQFTSLPLPRWFIAHVPSSGRVVEYDDS